MRWFGAVLVILGIASVAYGLNTPQVPSTGAVALTSPEVVRAMSMSMSLGLVGSIFGIVFVALTNVKGASVHWRRAAIMFIGMALLVYLALQGPEIFAVAWHRDRAWVGTWHDVVSGALLCLTVMWTGRDLLKRSERPHRAR